MALVVYVLNAGSAYAQTQGPGSGGSGSGGGKKSFLYLTNLGDIEEAESANLGRVHLSSAIAVSNTDYSRGAFDGVPDDLDELVFGAAARLSAELFEEAGPALAGDDTLIYVGAISLSLAY